MSNIAITNNDLGSVVLELSATIEGILQNVEVTEQTYAEGTLLSRSASTGNLVPYAPAALEDNTVDVTVDVASIPANTAPDTAVVVPGALVGDSITVTPLGTWPAGLTEPQGRCLVAGTVQVRIGNTTVGAIDPGSQSFRFSLGHDVEPPKYVLTYQVVLAASSTGPVTAMSAGKVNQNRLVIHDGTALTAAHFDALLDRPIVPVDVKQLAQIDNPQS
jgi:hypothetical protein